MTKYTRKFSLWLSAFIFFVSIFYSCHFFEKEIDFNAQVRPILNKNCISCHGGVKQAGGFSVLFREEALGVTKSGKPAIIEGDAKNSEFIKRLTHHDNELRMPLNKSPLTKEEIEILTKWVNQGAKWADHWAFINPKMPKIPNAKISDFNKNEIDNFIVEKLKEQKLNPSKEADKITLARRVSLDLIGLPTPDSIFQVYMADNSPKAYENLVDNLLQSPHFGERWAAVWLDLARYADSKGYEKDGYRNIWRYRDYVIKSFNENKPYNQFIIEQLAGDLLPNSSDEQKIATAFHRNTLNNDEGGADNEEFRIASVIDRTNTTFDALQGITFGCTQCHSHPYDPIRHKEYYKFMAFFNNTADYDSPDEAPTFVVKEDIDSVKAIETLKMLHQITHKNEKFEIASLKKLKRKYLQTDIEIADLNEINGWEYDKFRVYNPKVGAYLLIKNIDLTKIQELSFKAMIKDGMALDVVIDNPKGKKIASIDLGCSFFEWYGYHCNLSTKVLGVHDVYFIARKDKNGNFDGSLKEIGFVEKQLSNYQTQQLINEYRYKAKNYISPSGTPIMQDLPAEKSRITQVFVRGSFMNKGDTVTCDVPPFLGKLPENAPKNRLGMALWLTSDEHPLLARVAVNRFWEQIFGVGIVETLEDFGSQGIKPTHPALLDWLSVTFRNEYKWDVKKILKTIVMSGTYRQSSSATKEQMAIDPKNKYLSHMSRVRLSFEQIRDQSLAISGLLSTKIYGKSVMPYQPDGIWQVVYNDFKWKTAEGEDKYRRGLYTFMRRSSPYPNMITFDGPSREFCLVRRIKTNTPLQALATLNDTTFIESAQKLADLMLKNGNDVDQNIAFGYKKCLYKSPTTQKIEKLKQLYIKSYSFYKSNKSKAIAMAGTDNNAEQKAAFTVVASAIINLDEFLTKE